MLFYRKVIKEIICNKILMDNPNANSCWHSFSLIANIKNKFVYVVSDLPPTYKSSILSKYLGILSKILD